MSEPAVFVVMGAAGGYERTEWLVRAFLARPAAEDWATKAEEGAQRIAERTRRHWERHPDYDVPLPKMRNRWDPRAGLYTDAAEYSVVTVPLGE